MEKPTEYTVKTQFYFSGTPNSRTYHEGETVSDFTDEQVARGLKAGTIEAVEGKPQGDAPTGIDGMTKAQLIDYAKENSIEIDQRATKEVVLEAIKAAQA